MAANKQRQSEYKNYLKAEIQAAATYNALAEADRNPERKEVFRRLAQAEMRHASRWAEKLGIDPGTIRPPRQSLRLRVIKGAANIVGTRRVLPLLLTDEAKDIATYSKDPEAQDIAREEHAHAHMLRHMADGRSVPTRPGEQWSRTGGSGSVRAAVLGVNDGLVSNFSLVMGVAGGTSDPKIIVLAGMAGLLAGAFSMAAGEYVSVRSQRDLYEHQIEMERIEIEQWPEEEEEELTLIYRAKGMGPEEARRAAHQVIANPHSALDTMAREELGVDPKELGGSPWTAAISSYLAFFVGALVPILPYLFGGGELNLVFSAIFGGVALALVGGMIAGMTGKNILWGATRMVVVGAAAASVTFVAGRIVGQTLAA